MANNLGSEDIFNQHCATIERMTKEIISNAFKINPDIKIDEYIINGAIKQAVNSWEFLCYNNFIENLGIVETSEAIEIVENLTEEEVSTTSLQQAIYKKLEEYRDFRYHMSIISGNNTSCTVSILSDKPFDVHENNINPFLIMLLTEVLVLLDIKPVTKDIQPDRILDIGHISYAPEWENEIQLKFQLDREFNLSSLSWIFDKDGLLRLVYVTNN